MERAEKDTPQDVKYAAACLNTVCVAMELGLEKALFHHMKAFASLSMVINHELRKTKEEGQEILPPDSPPLGPVVRDSGLIVPGHLGQ